MINLNCWVSWKSKCPEKIYNFSFSYMFVFYLLKKAVELLRLNGLQSNLRRGRKRWELQLMVSPPPFLSQKSCSKIISKRTTLLHISALHCICISLHCIAYFCTLLHVSTLYCISLHCIVPAMGTVRSMMVLRTATDCLSYNSPFPSTHPPIRPPMNRCNKVIGNTLARADQCKELWSNLEMTLDLVNIEIVSEGHWLSCVWTPHPLFTLSNVRLGERTTIVCLCKRFSTNWRKSITKFSGLFWIIVEAFAIRH